MKIPVQVCTLKDLYVAPKFSKVYEVMSSMAIEAAYNKAMSGRIRPNVMLLSPDQTLIYLDIVRNYIHETRYSLPYIVMINWSTEHWALGRINGVKQLYGVPGPP